MTAGASVRARPVLIGAAIVAAAAGAVVFTAVRTRPVRQAVVVYTELLGAANRGDLATARRLCTDRYLETHRLEPAEEGGIVGLPRNIHPNFQAWAQGPHIWICPTNRAGPVYQFVHERGAWRFDGPVGLLRGRGEFIPQRELSEAGLEGTETRSSGESGP